MVDVPSREYQPIENYGVIGDRPRSRRRPPRLDDDQENERPDTGRGCRKGATSLSFAIQGVYQFS